MESALITAAEGHVRPRALDAGTMCEAFQITAAEHPDQVALRTIGDGVSITFGEYSQRVRRLAGGLSALGVGPGDTVGFMLSNRPEFHLLDTAAMHLGATPFSIYNTCSPEQIGYCRQPGDDRRGGVRGEAQRGARRPRLRGALGRARRRDQRLDHARRARGCRAGGGL